MSDRAAAILMGITSSIGVGVVIVLFGGVVEFIYTHRRLPVGEGEVINWMMGWQ